MFRPLFIEKPMKYYIILVILLLTTCVTTHAQTGYAYSDAVSLQNAISEKDSSRIRNIVSWYFNNGQGGLDKAALDVNNPCHRLLLKYVTSDVSTAVLSSPESGLTAISAANAIDALGTFIANRFKEEINVAFLNRFRKDLSEIPVLSSLLPQSSMVLEKSDPYNYANFMEALREAFANDLQDLPDGIATAIEKNQVIFKNQEDKYLVLIGLNFSQQVISNTGNPLIAFAALADNNFLDSLRNTDTKQSIEGVIYMVNALRIKDMSSRRVFMGSEEFTKLGRDTLLQQLYLTLLAQQNKNLSISSEIDSVLGKISKASALVQKINTQIAPLNNAIITNQLKTEQVLKYYQTTFNVLSELIQFGQHELGIKFSPGQDSVFSYLEQINRISGCVLNKQFALAALNSIQLLENAVGEQQLKSVRTYLLFATNILKAESSADMQQALENAALPVGSYRIKRNTTFSISLNAFSGLFAGGNMKADTALFGFSAPIGIYAGWGNIGKSNKRGGKSIGFYFPVIDVGAITSFRLAGGNAEPADVSWSNVFSPGAYLSIGLGKCPVSLNVGGQMGPELQSVSAAGLPVFYEKKWFWRAGVFIDIPVFGFYNYQHQHRIK